MELNWIGIWIDGRDKDFQVMAVIRCDAEIRNAENEPAVHSQGHQGRLWADPVDPRHLLPRLCKAR